MSVIYVNHKTIIHQFVLSVKMNKSSSFEISENVYNVNVKKVDRRKDIMVYSEHDSVFSVNVKR
ncbi:hypothetical protein KSF_038970 [Reticulibacter mediterranei]|uniref:Uncharacterized protein n=1 Tax=Reticulibacter mediterranei TaxID=2778369 RepID=A0A8J3N051_9CHLR|nr:hypothetical protein KSF_038970 [Reticulibacter mediterranei]